MNPMAMSAAAPSLMDSLKRMMSQPGAMDGLSGLFGGQEQQPVPQMMPFRPDPAVMQLAMQLMRRQ